MWSVWVSNVRAGRKRTVHLQVVPAAVIDRLLVQQARLVFSGGVGLENVIYNPVNSWLLIGVLYQRKFLLFTRR